jgi:hypothetical protein
MPARTIAEPSPARTADSAPARVAPPVAPAPVDREARPASAAARPDPRIESRTAAGAPQSTVDVTPVAVPPAVAPTITVVPPAAPDPPPVVETGRPVTTEELPKRRFADVIVKEGAVIGIRLDLAISTTTAKVEDKVTARVARDVTVDGLTAIPLGARLEGTVTVVQRGGKMKDRSRIGVRFETLLLADGTRVPLRTDTIFRDGEPPAGEATSKIGASAVVGAILGAVIGGKKGAAIGGTAGAAGGTAAVLSGEANAATIAAGTPLTVRLTAPVTVTIERDPPV